jgi:hypothetical protein
MNMLWALCLLFLSAGAAFAAQGTRTSEECLREAQAAIEAKDRARFLLVVDVEGISREAAAFVLEKADASSLPPLLALLLSSARSSRQALDDLRELLARETAAFVLYGVESGRFAGSPDRRVRPSGMLSPLFGEVSLGKKTLSPAGPESIDKSGRAFLPAVLHDAGNDRSYPLLLGLSLTPSGRRITEIVNLPDLWERILAEARE